MSVSASAGRRRTPRPGRYPLRRRFPAGPATCLRRVDRAREIPGCRLDGPRDGSDRRLRDRSRLQASRRRRATHVPWPGDGRGGVVRGCAVVGGVPGSDLEGADPGGAAQQLRRRHRRRAGAGSARECRRGALGLLSVTRLQRRRLQIARDSTAAYQRTYDLFLDRLNLGVASKLETSRALGALGDAQANIPLIESDIVAKENQISVLVGKAPGPIARGKPMYEQVV